MTDQLDARQRRRDATPATPRKGFITAPAGSFKNYKPVPGKPGFFDDGYGHLLYDPAAAKK